MFFLRKIKLRTYINTQRSEAKLIRNIKNYYSEDNKKLIMIIGNGNVNPSMKHIISTPNIGIKKLLKQNFITYHIDEFRTSCLNYKTEELCNNLYLPDKRNIERKMHSILTFKMENNFDLVVGNRFLGKIEKAGGKVRILKN